MRLKKGEIVMSDLKMFFCKCGRKFEVAGKDEKDREVVLACPKCKKHFLLTITKLEV